VQNEQQTNSQEHREEELRAQGVGFRANMEASNQAREIGNRDTKQKLVCKYTNAQSLGNKQDKLEAILRMDDIDMMGITEMWWDPTQDWNVNVEGFTL